MEKLKGISIKAILIGLVVDIMGSIISGFILGLILGLFYAMQRMSAEQIADKMKAPPVMIAGLIIGFVFTFIGGFIVGRIAKKSEILNACIMGLIGVLLGVCFATYHPLWFNAISFTLTIPIAASGGFVALKMKK